MDMKSFLAKRMLRINMLLVIIAIAGVLCSCSTDNDNVESVYNPKKNLFVISDEKDSYDVVDPSQPFNTTEKRLGETLDNYAVNMLVTYCKGNKDNTLLSPISAAILYSLMSNFTTDGTPNQFKKHLGIDGFNNSDINSYCQKLNYQNKLVENNSDSKFMIATDMWVRQDNPVYQSFLTMTEAYDVDVEGVDFEGVSDVSKIAQNFDEDLMDDNMVNNREELKNMSSMVTSK